jgi:hypothetical protein
MISRPNYFSSTETAGASFFRLGWHLGRLRPLLLILALSATSVRASAGELEDCNGATAEKIEPACTTVISDTSRPADDRLKAYTNRARLHTSRSKLDLALRRAKVHEAQSNPRKGTDDFRRATELTPASVFDVLAQAESKRKIQELSKRLPCGGGQVGTCL